MCFRAILCMILCVNISLVQGALASPGGASQLEVRISITGDIDGLNGHAKAHFIGREIDILPLFSSTPEAGVFDTVVGGLNQTEIAWTQEGLQDFEIQGAYVIIGSAGWGGAAEPPVLMIEGHDVGSFQTNEVENEYTYNYFDLTPYLSFLGQSEFHFSFLRPEFINNGNIYYDFGFLDFSAVVIVGRSYPGTSTPVPNPATALLLTNGLLWAKPFSTADPAFMPLVHAVVRNTRQVPKGKTTPKFIR